MFYNIDKRVGKQVWLFEDYNLKQDKVWTVASLHENDENHHDYYFTVTDGTESREVLWHDTVVLPDETITDEIQRIQVYLRDNGFLHDEVWHEHIIDTTLVRIAVNWGDWKHDHGWLNSLMGHIGYELFNEILTEEDGSDTYSSEHIFVRKDNPRYELLMNAKKIFS